MKVAINVYEYGRGGECACMFRYTSAGIIMINMQIEKEDRHMNDKHADRKGGQTYEQGHAYNKSTVPKICIEFEGKAEGEKKGGYEYKTKQKSCSARNTTRKTGTESNIHIRQRLIEIGKQTRNGLGGDRGYSW